MNEPKLSIVSAMGANRVIGAAGGLPWNVPDEYAHFLELVRGDTMLMGRRSWEIFGGDVTSAHNVVVSRSASEIDGAVVADSIERALEIARGYGRPVWSAGGGRIYEQTVPMADEMALSFIEGEYDGDTFFPAFDDDAWEIVERREHPAWTFVRYRRR